eukprot:1374858-Prymnesium_polylepis.1
MRQRRMRSHAPNGGAIAAVPIAEQCMNHVGTMQRGARESMRLSGMCRHVCPCYLPSRRARHA